MNKTIFSCLVVLVIVIVVTIEVNAAIPKELADLKKNVEEAQRQRLAQECITIKEEVMNAMKSQVSTSVTTRLNTNGAYYRHDNRVALCHCLRTKYGLEAQPSVFNDGPWSFSIANDEL